MNGTKIIDNNLAADIYKKFAMVSVAFLRWLPTLIMILGTIVN